MSRLRASKELQNGSFNKVSLLEYKVLMSNYFSLLGKCFFPFHPLADLEFAQVQCQYVWMGLKAHCMSMFIHTQKLDCDIWLFKLSRKIQIILDLCCESKRQRNITAAGAILIFNCIFWTCTLGFIISCLSRRQHRMDNCLIKTI